MDDETEISLEDLGKTYQQLYAQENAPQPDALTGAIVNDEDNDAEPQWSEDDENAAEGPIATTPDAIIEAVLFVGHPRGKGINAAALASMMRGVAESEIPIIVQQLNERYELNRNAFRVDLRDDGYHLILEPSMSHIKAAFAGKVQTFKLNQQTIDCLSLIAYRPGTTLSEIETQWNRPAGAIVRMLLRRNLVELKRDGQGKSAVDRYYPADRFFEVVGIDSLDDLPRVD